MLNLLSTTEKKKVLVEYRLRLAVIAIFAVGALIFSSLVLLTPSYLLAVSKNNDANNILVALEEKESRVGKEKDVNLQILAVNKNIDLFLKVGTTTVLVPPVAIMKILGIRGSAIKITGFTYDAWADQERIVINGIALDRERLSQFVETLKKDPAFTSIELPISSYVKSANIDFSVVITRKTKK